MEQRYSSPNYRFPGAAGTILIRVHAGGTSLSPARAAIFDRCGKVGPSRRSHQKIIAITLEQASSFILDIVFSG